MRINRSGYYKWKYRKIHPSKRHIQRMKDVEFIKEESSKHKAHGYRWLAAYIKKHHGVIMSPEYVYRCRKYAGVICESKHYRYKKPGENSYIYPNLIWNNWNASKPLEIIVSDMTSFYSKGKYYELILYFDTFNREIVGFGLTDRRGDINPYFEGLEQVINLIKEKEQTGLSTLHTDQGSVYSSEAFNMLLINNNIIHSMSRAGTPTDNPIDESLNGWIKDELFIDFNLKKCDDVLSLIKDYINYYNYERPMYCLKYKTPYQYKCDMGVYNSKDCLLFVD